MCAIFGLLDYKGTLTPAFRVQIIKELGTAAEIRGTDATGIAFFQRGRLCIQKAPKPAHKMKYRIPNQVQYIAGHTRLTTQGNAKQNQNNHPFPGKAGNTQFALAHNGVLYNDRGLRERYQLPETSIETDSYIAVQLIERQKELSFQSIQKMAEALNGSFTFTILDQENNLYFVKGENPLTIYHYPELGVYLYASTEEILQTALDVLQLEETPEAIHPWPGEILRIDAKGHRESVCFHMADDFPSWGRGPFPLRRVSQKEYLHAVKTVAAFHGFEEEYVESLLQEGYTTDDIEDIAVVILGQEFKYAKITRDEEMIANLIAIEEAFWNVHVLPRVMPSPDGSEACDEVLKQYFRRARRASTIPLVGFDERLNRRTELVEQITALEQEKAQIEQEVKLFMQDSESAVSDKYRVTWSNVDTPRLDAKRIKAEKPELYKAYAKVISSRRLTIKTAS